MDGMEKNYDRCLAAMVFHQNTILQLPANHAARSIMLYSHSSVRNMLATHVHVMHAWETNNGLTGIPPHIKTLVDVEAIRATQDEIVDTLYARLMTGVQTLLDQ
jgi:hypothetical protein